MAILLVYAMGFISVQAQSDNQVEKTHEALNKQLQGNVIRENFLQKEFFTRFYQPPWHKSLVDKTPKALEQEYLQLQMLQNYLTHEQMKKQARIEAMLATYVALKQQKQQ